MTRVGQKPRDCLKPAAVSFSGLLGGTLSKVVDEALEGWPFAVAATLE